MSNIDPQTLPNPHLSGFLGPDFGGMTAEMQKVMDDEPLGYGPRYRELTPVGQELVKPLFRAHLKAAHLPSDYMKLSAEGRREAREAVYTSWYDPKQLGELVTNVDNLIAGLYLYVEHLLKPDPWTGGMYTMRDPITKYELVRQCMSPPRLAGEPAKTVIHQPRGTTKTVTIIRQLMPFLCITRPYTRVLVSEINEFRTKEEIGAVRNDIENCQTLHAEFGGRGELWPRSNRTGMVWSNRQLDFLRFPMCGIMGYSLGGALRGRHPVFGVIDDPEDKDTCKQEGFKREFLEKLFGTYIGMFYQGGKIVWLGTIMRSSCIELALRGVYEARDSYGDADLYIDPRFEDWNRIRNGMIRETADGQRHSIMPDHTSVAAYDERIRARGAAIVSEEYDGDALPEGELALLRDECRHGYMHCQRRVGDRTEEYFLDLYTGTEQPWRTFLDELRRFGGCDPSDSLDLRADPGAVSLLGISPYGVVFLLDCVIARKIADDWPEVAMLMAAEWGAERIGWEIGGMQRVVQRMAARLAREIEEEGRPVPKNVPIVNHGTHKYQRVLAALRPLYRKNLIRFPRFTPFKDAEGVVHTPIRHPNETSLREMYSQLDTYTDEGPARGDDGPDSLQIALRAAGSRRGRPLRERGSNLARLERLAKLGIRLSPDQLPPEVLTPEVRRFMGVEDDPEPAMVGADGGLEGWHDPYD
jgi:hypothetical protein